MRIFCCDFAKTAAISPKELHLARHRLGREDVMRFGIDLGGTKIEILALDGRGQALRRRIATPNDYAGLLRAAQRSRGRCGSPTR